jgi:hypothetical protein
MPWGSPERRRRLPDPTSTEFSRYGPARTRVERIVIAAKANQRAICAYSGVRAGLFDAAFGHRIGEFHASLLFDEYDPAQLGGRVLDKSEGVEHAAGRPRRILAQ